MSLSGRLMKIEEILIFACYILYENIDIFYNLIKNVQKHYLNDLIDNLLLLICKDFLVKSDKLI